jgi:hypothetical protein
LKSVAPAGLELRGLGYTRAQPSIKAKEDDAYPDWLWTLLDEAKTGDGTPKVDVSGNKLPSPPPVSYLPFVSLIFFCSPFPTITPSNAFSLHQP